jgi:hypothetical protein
MMGATMPKTLALKPRQQKQVNTLLAEREKPSRAALVSQALILGGMVATEPGSQIRVQDTIRVV